jgi:hypothetical protein
VAEKRWHKILPVLFLNEKATRKNMDFLPTQAEFFAVLYQLFKFSNF